MLLGLHGISDKIISICWKPVLLINMPSQQSLHSISNYMYNINKKP